MSFLTVLYMTGGTGLVGSGLSALLYFFGSWDLEPLSMLGVLLGIFLGVFVPVTIALLNSYSHIPEESASAALFTIVGILGVFAPTWMGVSIALTMFVCAFLSHMKA